MKKQVYKLVSVLMMGLLFFSGLSLQQSNKVDAASKTMYVTTSSLNVRTGPSTKYKVITKANKNQSVSVSQSKGSWSKVTVNKKTGWVSSKYLTSKKPITSKTMYVNASTPLKTTASSKGKTLITPKTGSSVTVYSTSSGSYYKAKFSNKTGWILKSKVSDTKKVKLTQKETIAYKTVKKKIIRR